MSLTPTPVKVLLLVSLIAGPVLADGNVKTLPKLTSSQWREDLQYFAREMPIRHANAFHHISRTRFEAEVAELDRRIPQLDGDEVYAGLDRIACLIGDGHTFVRFPDDSAEMPLQIRRFGGEFRVAAVTTGLERALGTRVLKVGDTPVDRAADVLKALTPQDESPELAGAQVASWLTTGMALRGLGLVPKRNLVRYTLIDDGEHEFPIEVSALSADAQPRWVRAYGNPPLFRQKPEETFWYSYLPEARTVYCSFRGYKNLHLHAAGLWKLVDEQQPDKLVIDMRLNGGGDYTLGLRYLVGRLRDRPNINRKGHVFVLIGTQTFSAAMSNSAHFRAQTAATLVGETIGEKPNSYQEARQMKLPNSQLTVQYSVRFYKFVESGENMIRPDREIIPTWDDYKAGRDPVLEWVLKYRVE